MTPEIWIYDCEVFAHDWFVVAVRIPEEGATPSVPILFHNENFKLAEWINEGPKVLGGYNTKHYDNWILKAIYNGAEPELVKELNDFILAGNNGWNFQWLNFKPNPWGNFDLMDDIPVPLRLKEIEGNLGMSIEESGISFDLDRPLTPKEAEEVIRYCWHDVTATVQLYHARKEYLQSKIAVGTMKGISAADSLCMTNAKLTAEYLGARFNPWDDETVYQFPDNLRIDRYPQVLEFFKKVDPTYKRKLTVEIAGVPHVLAWGGLHGALECYGEESTDTRSVVHIDVTSYYPSLMIVNGYLSRNAPEPEEFKRVYERRIAAKKAGDKATANALKLVLNTTYGAMKNKYNKLYDPRMANAVCISGQLYLIDLIEKLEQIPSFRLIQSNTDGLIVSYDNVQDVAIRGAIAEWEERTGFFMGMDGVQRIVQKDVNNYVLLDEKGAIEVKGGYVSNYTGGDFVNRSLVAVARAVVDFLLFDKPIEDSLHGEVELWQYQMITKAGSTYKRVEWELDAERVAVQNVNRVYAVRGSDYGGIYKIKEVDGQERSEKIANTPEHCFIDNENEMAPKDLDLDFYRDMARKRVDDYLGVKPVKPKKERKSKKMAVKKEPEQKVEITDPRLRLYQKLLELQTIMDGFTWTKDGINRHQSYKYITEQQYKANFKKARAKVGLIWHMDEIGREYVGAISDKMHLLFVTFRGRLIDPETGEAEEYTFSGSGADNGDKALYKAYTGGFKYHVASNYLVAEGNDPESDEEEVKPKHVPPERRETIREQIASPSGAATEAQLETIAAGFELLAEAEADEEAIQELLELAEGDLTKEEAEAIIDAINELLPEDAAS